MCPPNPREAGLWSIQGETSINFHFITAPLRSRYQKKCSSMGLQTQGRHIPCMDTGSLTLQTDSYPNGPGKRIISLSGPNFNYEPTILLPGPFGYDFGPHTPQTCQYPPTTEYTLTYALNLQYPRPQKDFKHRILFDPAGGHTTLNPAPCNMSSSTFRVQVFTIISCRGLGQTIQF